MSSALNNSIKYNFTIRTFIQVLYEFRTRKALDLLRIDDFDSFTSEARIVTITDYFIARNVTVTTYSVIIRSATVETSLAKKISSINQRRIPSSRMVISIRLSIFFVKELTSRQMVTLMKIIFFVRSSTSVKTSIAKKTPFIAISRIAIINEYRSSHIDVKNAIVFASLKMKKFYDTRHQFIFFKIEDLINLRLHKNYKVFIITSKKIKL